ncbi:hypothetical protein [Reichenbachiella sp.]|uniref:hypothetical protein n=1 Tax=Reichenbachiella sp. TaxID=2184521 RepID=UPI003B5A98F8
MSKPIKNGSHLIVFIYNSFLDPLFQNILFDYLKSLSSKKKITYHVVTFEQSQYKINWKEREHISYQLRKNGIEWYPMKFHTGRFLVLKKAFDLIQVFFLIAKFKIKLKAKAILAFANVSAAYSYIFARIFRLKLLVYSYEPHSDFLVELGLWNVNSTKYKLLNTLETKAGIEGDYIMTGTRHMVELLEKKKAKGKVYRAPTGIDKSKFYPLDVNSIKQTLGVTDKKILFYIGKFGDLYYSHEIPRLFHILKKEIPELFFLVITPSPISEVESYFNQYDIQPEDYSLLASNFTQEEINKYINVANICLSAVPPSYSQKFRSPTKVGEYLMCGKPFITCRGVSEDDEYASTYNTGVVVNDFSIASIQTAVPAVVNLLNESPKVVQERCRKTGIAYRDKNNVLSVMDKILDEIYCKNN